MTDRELFEFRVIVAGSRIFKDKTFAFQKLDFLTSSMDKSKIQIVCGEARGADTIGRMWAEERGIPVASFPANWSKVDIPGALVKTNHRGSKYNARAGIERNIAMAEFGTHLVAFWDGKSRGTANMIQLGKKFNLEIRVIRYNGR